MDEKIRSLLDNLRIIENRANGYREYFKDDGHKQVRLIADGCETIRRVVNQVENGER